MPAASRKRPAARDMLKMWLSLCVKPHGLYWVPPQSRVGYLLPRWRGPATPPTYLLSEAVKIYMYVG